MKEIIKETTVIKKDTYFQATDGRLFTSPEECRKYETSAVGVLLEKTTHFEIAREFDSQWFDDCDENEYRTLLPKTEKDIDVLNQLYSLYAGKKALETYFTNDDIDKLILLGLRQYDGRVDWLWFYKFDDMLEQMTNGKYTYLEKYTYILRDTK